MLTTGLTYFIVLFPEAVIIHLITMNTLSRYFRLQLRCKDVFLSVHIVYFSCEVTLYPLQDWWQGVAGRRKDRLRTSYCIGYLFGKSPKSVKLGHSLYRISIASFSFSQYSQGSVIQPNTFSKLVLEGAACTSSIFTNADVSFSVCNHFAVNLFSVT